MNTELHEVSGVTAGTLTRLCEIEPFPGYVRATSVLFLAEDLVPSRKEGDEIEELQVHRMKLDEAIAKIRAGEITDARTVAGLFIAKDWIERERP
jgi:hypothetical protein